MKRVVHLSILTSFAFGSLGKVHAQHEIPPEHLTFFESKIRPVLVEHCYQCHSVSSDKSRGGLLLDSRDAIRRGGDTGPAVVPGDPGKSLLLAAIRYEDKDTAMPPEKSGGKLTDAVIADFERWIELGAPDPREANAGVKEKTYDAEKAKSWWAFQPLIRPAVPPLNSNWPRSDIDRFVLEGMKGTGLSPIQDADRLTLLRRISFDLIGLPPSPDQIRRFLHDTSPRSLEKLVDEFLAMPQFGERWGRHWLDVARYAESTGRDLNVAYPHAWRYRDYVIDAFNQDKPFNQFIREQIAGDLLPAKDSHQRAEQLIATGFLAVGPKGLGELTPRQYELDLADEMVDATTQGFLGLTVSCARCHDHKFDPISQRDYYAMAGIFLSTEVRYGTLAGPKNNQERELVELPTDAGLPAVKPKITDAERREIESQYTAAKTRYDGLMAQRNSSRGTRRGATGGTTRGGSGPQFFIQVQVALGNMAKWKSLLDSYDENGNAKAFCMGVQDKAPGPTQPRPMGETKVVEIKGSSGIRPPSGFETIADSPLFVRGEMNQPADRVPRGFLSFLSRGSSQRIPHTSSGRMQLAEWIASPEHPLTARVMANRIWHWLFGQGIVTTVDNFGTMGSAPTNQPLLDHLANRLIDNKWSVKATIREVVLSRTYQLASDHHLEFHQIDPQNARLWRHSKRRLDAESIRDAMLAASGQLDLKRPVGSALAIAGDGVIGSTGAFVKHNEDHFLNAVSHRRSVYLPIARDLLPDALAAFDYSEAGAVMGAREQTNVPAQSLYLLNHPFVAEQAGAFAGRLATQPVKATQDGIKLAYAIAFGRQVTESELKIATAFIEREIASGASQEKAWSHLCLALFATAEFRILN